MLDTQVIQLRSSWSRHQSGDTWLKWFGDSRCRLSPLCSTATAADQLEDAWWRVTVVTAGFTPHVCQASACRRVAGGAASVVPLREVTNFTRYRKHILQVVCTLCSLFLGFIPGIPTNFHGNQFLFDRLRAKDKLAPYF